MGDWLWGEGGERERERGNREDGKRGEGHGNISHAVLHKSNFLARRSGE